MPRVRFSGVPDEGPLPLSEQAAARLGAIRAAGGILYAAVLVYAPAEVTTVDPPPLFIGLALLVALATSLPRLWRTPVTRVGLTLGDLTVILIVVAMTGDRLLIGALVTTAVVTDAGLPRRWQRVGLVTGPIIVGVSAIAQIGFAAGMWTGLFTSAVLLLVTRARQETDRHRHQAARTAAAVNRIQIGLASSVDGMAWRAERARPTGHDIAAVIGGMAAMVALIQRSQGVRGMDDDISRLRAAYDQLAKRLNRASELARRTLRATVLLPSPDDERRNTTARHLGRIPMRTVVVASRVIVYTTFFGFAVSAVDGAARLAATTITVTGLLTAVPMFRSADPRVQFATHLHDAVAICVAIATIGGLTGPIAPVVVGQAAITAVNLERSEHRHWALAATAAGLVVIGALADAGPPGSHLLIAGWWIVTLNWGHLWFRQIHVQSDAHERWLQQIERDRRLTAREARDALRLASEVDAAFDEFTDTARTAAQRFLDAAAPLAGEHGPTGRAASVLRDEASHLLELVDDLTLQTSDDLAPLSLRTGPATDMVQPALATAVEAGVAELVDRTGDRAVTTSRHHVERIVRNLVSNSLRYRRDRPVRVTIDAAEDHWSIQVTDDGPGLSPTEFRRLCGKYAQGPDDDQAGQFGLGLWITARNVQALGGSIQPVREDGAFTVRVDLPSPPPDAGSSPVDATLLATQEPLTRQPR